MPTYEYECKSCKHTFDVFQAMKDEPIKICPKCGKSVRRVINGGTGIIFKGSGFYVTDKGGKTVSSGGGKSGGEKSGAESAAAKPATAGSAESAPCPACPKADTCAKAANS